MKKITIPRLGWSMDEGTLVEWLKQPGEMISRGDMLFVLEGDKASQEVESFDSGILHVPDDAPQPGDEVIVGQLIGFLLNENEPAPDSIGAFQQNVPRPKADSMSGAAGSGESPGRPAGDRPAGPAARRLARELGVNLADVASPDPTGRIQCIDVERAHLAERGPSGFLQNRVLATPRARRSAGRLAVDIVQVKGSGRNGRIRERDVVAFHAKEQRVASMSRSVPGEFVPASPIRKVTAQRMLAGAQQAAPVTITTKTNASQLVSFREELKSKCSSNEVPSYNDIIVKLTSIALERGSPLNACWHDNGVYFYEQVNICVGIDTDQGLVAPVIQAADRKTLSEITRETRQLIAQAKNGKLAQDQLSGGTFTVTNLGMFDIDFFNPILNLPQSAALGVGRIVQEPIVEKGLVTIGSVISLSLTFDHQVVDGAPAARWLQALCKLIQSPTILIS